MRRGFLAEAVADLAFGIGMQGDIHTQRRGSGLPRMIVRRHADAAETEHDVAVGKAACERLAQACRVVAEVVRPVERHAARTEQLNNFGEVLVRPFSGENFVADDEGADAPAGFTFSLHALTAAGFQARSE